MIKLVHIITTHVWGFELATNVAFWFWNVWIWYDMSDNKAMGINIAENPVIPQYCLRPGAGPSMRAIMIIIILGMQYIYIYINDIISVFITISGVLLSMAFPLNHGFFFPNPIISDYTVIHLPGMLLPLDNLSECWTCNHVNLLYYIYNPN